MIFLSGKKVHFIGVGGASMSALIRWAKLYGAEVSGSDGAYSKTLSGLIEDGFDVYVGTDEKRIDDVDIVVYTSAVSDENPELSRARSLKKTAVERHVFLGLLSENFKKVIAVSGTHGKTTVTSLIAAILKNSGKKFTAHIGGFSNDLGGNFVRTGDEILVTEACEYKGHFLSLHPDILAILNVECDHPDCINTLSDALSLFAELARNVPNNGLIIKNSNVKYCDLHICKNVHIENFGGADAKWQAENIYSHGGICEYDILRNREYYMRIRPALLGRHNVKNVLAAVAVCDALSIDKNVMKEALENFKGVKRRLEKTGEVNGADVYVDYAHHPSEITASISAIKPVAKNRLFVIFQPHTFSRTAKYFQEFALSFNAADEVWFVPTYPAREKESDGKTSFDLFRYVDENVRPAEYVKDFVTAAKKIKETARAGDVIMIMGAGDVDIIADLKKKKKKKKKKTRRYGGFVFDIFGHMQSTTTLP